jgi:hypothetical protein
MYTIELDQDGKTRVLAISFADCEDALVSARALLKSGFRVSRIVGSGYEIANDDVVKRARRLRRPGAQRRAI